jgi:TetR/AcrR family transcriptional regulator, regulator of autoinduction and epiphytic fitness
MGAVEVLQEQTGEVVAYDGRRARRDRNTEAVIRGCWSLFMDGVLQPTAQQVAERSGVSLRSVFRHFQNLDALLRAAVEWFVQTNTELLVYERLSVDRPVAERIESFVQYRLRVYREAGRHIAAAIVRGGTDTHVRGIVDAHRAYVVQELQALFAPELEEMDAVGAAVATACLQTAVQFEAWENLAVRHGLDEETIAAWMRAGMQRALTQERPKPQ